MKKTDTTEKTDGILLSGHYGSPRWTNEIADCSMPMTFDTYSNCSFGCAYCFSQYQRQNGAGGETYRAKKVRAVDVEKIKELFRNPSEDNPALSKTLRQFVPYVRQRRVMQWGGLSDQFDGYERRYGKTLELLRFFREIDYPLCFSTKATWWTLDERYMEGVRLLKDMEYDEAVKILGPYQDYNAAVAYMAAERNASAMLILQNLKRTPQVDYLLAILHSRNGDAQKAVQCYLDACRADQSFVHRGNLDPEISQLIKLYGLNRETDEGDDLGL